MKKTTLNPIVKALAKHFHREMDKIADMHPVNIDELCKQADAVAKVQAQFDRLPKCLQYAVGNVTESQINY